MMTKRDYQRKHLRAPFKMPVLFEDEGYVHKANTLNISEGGLLFDMLPHFPAESDVSIMLPIPQFPLFKNFSVGRLKDFSQEIFQKKIIRVQGHMVRREGTTKNVDDVFMSRIGLKFSVIEPQAQKIVSDYVNTFVSNIVFLQALLDNVNSDDVALMKTRVLGSILGYEEDMKISIMRKRVTHDYRSLQWL
jgi:hypothetical protein